MKRSELLILCLSLILGFSGTCAYGRYAAEPRPRRVEQAAWWGGLYPEYCLPGALEAAEESGNAPDTEETGTSVRIGFKYLTFLNGTLDGTGRNR